MKSIIISFLSFIIILVIFLLLTLSLDLEPSQVFNAKIDLMILFMDIYHSFLRVTFSALVSVISAIITGKIISFYHPMRYILIPVINFVRHISPFAWLPFALIWFGLGEAPAFFILLIALYFPSAIMAIELFDQIPREFIEEASICGADDYQIFLMIEIPFLKIQFLNLFRILWGLGFTTVIAVEMLGVEKGLGFRLLDLRYLLKYEEMIIYIVIMGLIGVAIDFLLLKIVKIYKAASENVKPDSAKYKI